MIGQVVDTNFPYIDKRKYYSLLYIEREGRIILLLLLYIEREGETNMNKTRTCSKCGKVTKITMKGVTECPKCGTPFKPQTPNTRKSK